MKLKKFVILVTLLLSACSSSPKLSAEEKAQKKIHASETKQAELINRIAGAKGCSKLSINIEPFYDIGVDVMGTFTNECDKKITYAEIEIACFGSANNLVDVDTEYVQDVLPGKDAYFKSPMNATPSQVTECKAKIIEAEY